MFDTIVKYINDIIAYINSFIEKKETGDYNKFYNLLILGLIVYILLQLLNVFKINSVRTISHHIFYKICIKTKFY